VSDWADINTRQHLPSCQTKDMNILPMAKGCEAGEVTRDLALIGVHQAPFAPDQPYIKTNLRCLKGVIINLSSMQMQHFG